MGNITVKNSLKNCLKCFVKLLFRLLQKACGKYFLDDHAVIVSKVNLGKDERIEIINRLRFYAPSFADGAKFQKEATLTDLLSARPILMFGEDSYKSSRICRLRSNGVFNIDYLRNPVDGWEWCRLSQYLSSMRTSSGDAQLRLQLYLDRIMALNLSRCYIFGTGSSLSQAIEFDWSDGYRVVCNTIVRDKELWNHINPHFVVAGDAIYHFGFTEFARTFRADLKKRLAETETCIVYPEEFHEIVSKELEEYSERLIPVPQGTHDRFLTNLVKDFELPGTGNILNLLLLPLGCTLNKNVYLWGFDGRAPDDKLFWSNSPKHSYPELMDTLLKAHPAFFESMVPSENPSAYVNSVHGDELDTNLTAAEAKGWKFVMMHKSWTPTLQKRFQHVS